MTSFSISGLLCHNSDIFFIFLIFFPADFLYDAYIMLFIHILCRLCRTPHSCAVCDSKKT